MNKQQQIKNLKEQIICLKKEMKNELVIQRIPARILEWGKTADMAMDWDDAKKWCKEQGNAWRLPTRPELLQAHIDNAEGFDAANYWSSAEGSSVGYAWGQNFSDGGQSSVYKDNSDYIRCVRRV